MEDKILISSVIHYSEDICDFKIRDNFDSFTKYNIEDYIKIYSFI